jgi:hypothetical protein
MPKQFEQAVRQAQMRPEYFPPEQGINKLIPHRSHTLFKAKIRTSLNSAWMYGEIQNDGTFSINGMLYKKFTVDEAISACADSKMVFLCDEKPQRGNDSINAFEVKARQRNDPLDERTKQPWTERNSLGWDVGSLVCWNGCWVLSQSSDKNIVFRTESDLERLKERIMQRTLIIRDTSRVNFEACKSNYHAIRKPYMIKLTAPRTTQVLTDRLVFPWLYACAFECDQDHAVEDTAKIIMIIRRYLTALHQEGDVNGFMVYCISYAAHSSFVHLEFTRA